MSIRDMYFTESSIMTASSWKDYHYRLAKAEPALGGFDSTDSQLPRNFLLLPSVIIEA